ncbi:MAG: flagellar basal-body MS-ring/collar protein FliF [Armatimonadota bacterium]|nr:flagellar M-ring protein FliF [bacterium]
MDQIANIGPFAALIKLWNQLNPTQRVVVTAFAALSVVLMIFVGMAATKPRMSVLFSGLGQEDAGAIVQKLSEQKVPYKLSGDGSTVEVPENKVYDLRLQMATQGLPQGGNVGFELFDKTNFGMTEFTEKLNYQRAIQGELTRTICQLAPVMNARVHIAMPEEQVYASDQEPPTASVVLKLRRGMPLTDEQVGGVVHLVASAVEGLKPNNVTVIDSEGSVLSEGPSSEGGGLMTSNQTKLKRQYESELAQNLQSMLAKIVGADKVVVRVSADLNFDQRQMKSESYEPVAGQPGAPGTAQTGNAHGVLLSEAKTTESYAGGVIPPSNLPAAASRIASSGKDNYSRSESTTQYEVTKRIEETMSAPGQLKRLSVAVLVDDKVDPTKVAAIQEAVSAAAGVTPTRGDQITVQRVAFDTMSEKKIAQEMASASKSELLRTVAKDAGAAIMLIVFLVFLKMIIKQIKVQVPAPPVASLAAATSAPAPVNPAELIATTGGQASPKLENQPIHKSDQDLPAEIAQSSPEELARLVRNWMSE